MTVEATRRVASTLLFIFKIKHDENEHFKHYLDKCIQNKVNFKYVLADSWYGSKSNMNYIDEELEKSYDLWCFLPQILKYSSEMNYRYIKILTSLVYFLVQKT